MLAASILAALAFQPSVASAQEAERKERLDRVNERLDYAQVARHGLHSVKGAGVAVDQETGDRYRSGFRFIVQKAEGTDSEFDVKRGLIGILVDGERVYYTAIPDTWTIALSEDRLAFRASGQVENGDQVFEVNLNGYFAMHTRLGSLWSINGEMEGRESQYDLHYVGISHGIRAAALDEEQ